MSVLTQIKKPQTFTIEGPKFFKKHLEKIEYDSMVTDHPITTSEISVFMLLHLYTDETGQIRTLTNDPEISDRKRLCISNLASEHDLTYETVKKAFDSLLERSYIKEIHTAKGMHYEIVDYDKYNQLINTQNPEKSTYIIIPNALFKEKIFGELIKQRYHKGPILLLRLSEYFTMQLGTNRRYVEDAKLVKGERTMSYLKEKLNTTAKRVRNFLKIINNVFSFNPVGEKLKMPSPNRHGRIREFIQVCIEKFEFSLNGACFKLNDDKEDRRLFAKCKREMAARIKNAKIPIKWREMKDIQKSISRMVNIAVHLKVVNLSDKMLNYTISSVADRLEKLHLNGEINSIKSIGAYANSIFTKAFIEFQKDFMSINDRIEIQTAYANTYGVYPPFLVRN